MQGEYEMVVIDVLENPQLAEDERITGHADADQGAAAATAAHHRRSVQHGKSAAGAGSATHEQKERSSNEAQIQACMIEKLETGIPGL